MSPTFEEGEARSACTSTGPKSNRNAITSSAVIAFEETDSSTRNAAAKSGGATVVEADAKCSRSNGVRTRAIPMQQTTCAATARVTRTATIVSRRLTAPCPAA
jgi:hypothetical protein